MKRLIKSSNPIENTIINMNKVLKISLESSKDSKGWHFYILFSLTGMTTRWKYKDEKLRDADYNTIIKYHVQELGNK